MEPADNDDGNPHVVLNLPICVPRKYSTVCPNPVYAVNYRFSRKFPANTYH